MFLYIKTNILRGYGIFKNDFAHPREPATVGGAGGLTIPPTPLKFIVMLRQKFRQRDGH